ncbi:MAG: hypothetical protein ABR548_02860 [Actinomycetota bacterium]
MRWLRGLVVAALALGSVLPAAPARAAKPGLTVTPAVSELTIGPGETITESVIVANKTAAGAKVEAAVGDIVPGANGAFEIRPASTTENSAAAWVSTTQSSVDLGAGESALLTLSIKAPVGEPAGGHYAGVLFSIEGGPNALHAMLIEVSGVGILRQAKLLGISMPKLEMNGHVPFRIEVQNTGNTFASFGGTISIHDRLRRNDVSIAIPRFYALPGRITTVTVTWLSPPPILVARVTAHIPWTFPGAAGGDVAESRTTGVVIIWWAVAIIVGLVLLVFRLLVGLFSRRSREDRRARHERRVAKKEAASVPKKRGAAAASELPPPMVAPKRSAWDEQAHTPTAGALAMRRARTALDMLREGAGESGVRVDVAIGLLQSVQGIPDVLTAVEGAYADAARRRATREAAALSLALAVMDSVDAPEALLRAYAKADHVLAPRVRKALGSIDPAELRSHADLLEELPPARRQALPVS